jgi:hypothetical protein
MFQWHPEATNPSSETLGATTASSAGTSVTASATANTKGSYVDIGGVTSFAYEELHVNLLATTGADFTADLAINVGGNRFIIAEDLRIRGRAADNGILYPLALHVPAGAQLSMRCQSSSASAVLSAILHGRSSGLRGMPGFARLRALYAPATSRGVNCDAGAVANTKTRTQIVASSSARVVGLLGYVGPAADTARTGSEQWLMDISVGPGAGEWNIISNLLFGADATTDTPYPSLIGPMACDIPAATRFSVNLQCSSTTAGDRQIDVALWGYEP